MTDAATGDHASEVDMEFDRAVVAGEMFSAKYAPFQTDNSQMSPIIRSRLAAQRVFLESEPDGRILSWDNRRLGL